MPFWKKNKKDGDAAEKESGKNAFFDKVLGYFSADPQKEKILRREDFHAAGDPYYATVSARYKVAQRVLVLLLVAFLLLSIFTNIKEITYGNLFYFVRDFGNAVDIASVDHETLSYDVYKNQNFSLYRGGIAAVSPSNISVYTATGRRTLKSRADFVAPYAVCSEKYVLVYDMSGNSFALYNSFSKVYAESLDAPITDAAISDSGVFAVVTSSSGYRSVIKVYNKNLKLIGKYSKDMFSIDIAIDKSGERMAVLFYDIGDGLGRTVLRIYDISNRATSEDKDPDEDRILYESTLSRQFPLSCDFLEDGKLSVITNASVSVITQNKKEYDVYESLSYDEDVSAAFTGASGSAVALRSGALNDANRIIAFGSDGDLIYDDIIRDSAKQLFILGNYIFVRTDTGVLRFDISSRETEKYTCPSGNMLVYDESTVIICGESKAVYIKFGR